MVNSIFTLEEVLAEDLVVAALQTSSGGWAKTPR
jgi:hypothetical protein